MKMNKRRLLPLALMACVSFITSAAKAQVPNFGGSYNISGYFEPGLGGPYTWCFNFTKTGSVLFPNSGTWDVPSYPFGWSGTWYQDGDEIIFHGVADKTYIFSWKGRLDNTSEISGRQVEFLINGNTDTAGTFIGSKVSSCTDLESALRSESSDPAK